MGFNNYDVAACTGRHLGFRGGHTEARRPDKTALAVGAFSISTAQCW
jgi:hypothetical protein